MIEKLAFFARKQGVCVVEAWGNELRSPDGTEAEGEVGDVQAVGAALRATAERGVAAPSAAAQQTRRTSRGSCGVSHACG